jgi:protein subunit release factor B
MLRALTPHAWAPRATAAVRLISTAAPQWAKAMPRRPAHVPEEEFTEAFLCGSGPGGQKIVRNTAHCYGMNYR